MFERAAIGGVALLTCLALIAPVSARGVDRDPDTDGLATEAELDLGTDPFADGTDNDQLRDGFEVRDLGTDPLRSDPDEDGLGDGDELERFRTDPLADATDTDGIDDATELDARSDPRDPASRPGANAIDPVSEGAPVARLPGAGAAGTTVVPAERDRFGVGIGLAFASIPLMVAAAPPGHLAIRTDGTLPARGRWTGAYRRRQSRNRSSTLLVIFETTGSTSRAAG